MEIEVVGRHALLFDDDAMSAFVNSGDALVEWNSLQIDRYDVRHLLSTPPPSRRRRIPPPSASHTSDSSFEAELDRERYLDLPPPSDEPESKEAGETMDSSGYRAVPFSYGNDDERTDKRNEDRLEQSGFCPSFPVPESLRHNLPPSEKVHQIIARTAMFVCKHGGQSEIILRVKQGDNPTFGFLLPDHHLHPYFRYLVDHQGFLQSEVDGNLQMDERRENKEDKKSDAVGGALSLLGSLYGYGEDEDGATDDKTECNKTISSEKANMVSSVVSQGSGRSESSTGLGEKDNSVPKHPLPSQKVKASAIKKNPSVASRAGSSTSLKKEDVSGSFSDAMGRLKDSAVGTSSKVEPLIVEPPSDIKRTIDKIVEFIAKNGKQFEATLIEQDSKYGRFPFLLPSNRYHAFYLRVLQEAQESKQSGRSFLSGKDHSSGLVADKKASLSGENDSVSAFSVSDMLIESERKEKFKMVIGKTKKDGQDSQPKATPQEFGVTVDAAAAAAILQAAARGIKNPDLGIISSTFLNDKPNGQISESGPGSIVGSRPSSQTNNITQKSDQNGERSGSVPVAEDAGGEADSSETHLTKEQKLKAERLKRAKMFVAMLKGGAPASKTGALGCLSAEPQAPAALGSGFEINVSHEREASSAPPDDHVLNENEKTDRNPFDDEYNERRSKRKYRSRSGLHDEEDDEVEEEEEEAAAAEEEEAAAAEEDDREQKPPRKKHRSSREIEEEGGKVQKEKDRGHSKRKKQRSDRSSHADKDDEDNERKKHRKRSRGKHRSHYSSEEDSYGKEVDESEIHHKCSRRKHSSHRSLREERDGQYKDKDRDHKSSKKKHRSSSSGRSRHDHEHRKRHSSRDKESLERSHDRTSDGEYLRPSRNAEHPKESSLEELEEGEIGSKLSDQSRGSGGNIVSRETSLDIASSHQNNHSQPSEPTKISDDLRAKIRAMLMATR